MDAGKAFQTTVISCVKEEIIEESNLLWTIENANKITKDVVSEKIKFKFIDAEWWMTLSKNPGIGENAMTAKVCISPLSGRVGAEYVNTTEELQRVKKDYEQLKLRFSEVFQEIQEKAPIIQRTEMELEKATEVNSELNNQLDNLIRERVEIRQHSDELTMKVKSLESQTKELLRDRQDLSRQVCHLLQIIEQARGGQGPSRDDSITSDMSGNEVISKRLVTFGDILELQHNNTQLLALVRDLTAKIEEMDELKCHMDQATYEAKIEIYTRRLQEMQENMELQTRMMEKCISQREHYKELYNDLSKKVRSCFECDLCSKKFKLKDSLEIHMTSHMRVTPNMRSLIFWAAVEDSEASLMSSSYAKA